MRAALMAIFASIIFLGCQKDDVIETTDVFISCSRNFPVSVDGVDMGHCGGTSLHVRVKRGGIVQIVPDIHALRPDGTPTGGTSSGTAELRYNGKTETKYVSGNGATVVINW